MQLSGVHSLRVHGPAARDRWTGQPGTAAVSDGPVPKSIISVLWQAAGPDKSAVLGRGWIPAAV